VRRTNPTIKTHVKTQLYKINLHFHCFIAFIVIFCTAPL